MAALRAMDRTDDQAQALQDPVAFVPGSSLDPCGRPKAASLAQQPLSRIRVSVDVGSDGVDL